MKKIIIAVAVASASIAFIACNNKNNTASSTNGKDSSQASAPQTSANGPAKPGVDPKAAEAAKEMVNNYLQLKNSLTKDDAKGAASAGKALADDFGKFDVSTLNAEQKKAFQDIADDAKEMAEHIGKSADKLDHQREHFDMLSQDMIDLVKLLGAGQLLYVDHCPMYNNNKGANWLSETKTISNPYLGTKMPTCGAVKEELK